VLFSAYPARDKRSRGYSTPLRGFVLPPRTEKRNDLNAWTQYNFTPWFYVGFDVIYQKLETASNGATATYAALTNTAKPTAIYNIQNQDNYGLRIRVHRDIVP
jgi:hypothetical protein